MNHRAFLREIQRKSRPGAARLDLSAEYRARTSAWVIRLLLSADLDLDERAEANLLKALGLGSSTAPRLSQAATRRLLEKRLADLEKEATHPPGALHRNLARLADLLRLSPVETELLAFAVLARTEGALATCLRAMELSSSASTVDTIADILAVPRKAVKDALFGKSVLRSAGLLRIDPGAGDTVEERLDLLEGLETILLGEHEAVSTMFQAYFRPSPPTRLGLEDFAYLRDEVTVLRGLILGALKQETAGINVLIHGAPGVGKTGLVRALATACGAQLFEVSFEDEEDSGPTTSRQRFRAYLFGQRLLASSQRAVILFDEVEDVFCGADPFTVPGLPRGRMPRPDTAPLGHAKAWTNHVLESNPVPAIWLCNAMHDIDPAFLRRFQYVLELRTPPQSVRRKMLTQSLGHGAVSSQWISKVASWDYLTPAQIEHASKVLQLLDPTEAQNIQVLAEQVITSNLSALGWRPGGGTSSQTGPTPYRLDWLNASADLLQVISGLRSKPSARLCFSGPPGTGKTAFAYHLAQQLDKPLIHRRASDLLSCWVGETEANLARMFQQASREHAVLLLDEADSFLRDRRDAARSWEVTQVNELLVQMESFEGLFICCTNLVEVLDSAVFRRFDLKIHFRFLIQPQAWELFCETLKNAGAVEERASFADDLRVRLGRLDNLTPGDFATVVRRTRVLGRPLDGEELLRALEDECCAKATTRMIRGFAG